MGASLVPSRLQLSSADSSPGKNVSFGSSCLVLLLLIINKDGRDLNMQRFYVLRCLQLIVCSLSPSSGSRPNSTAKSLEMNVEVIASAPLGATPSTKVAAMISGAATTEPSSFYCT